MRRFHILIIASTLSACIVALSGIFIILRGEWQSLPELRTADLFAAHQSMVFTDRRNEELFRFYHDEDRTWVKLSSLPDHVWQAFVAIEDRRFFTRSCIDIRALSRAALANLSEYKSQGASTITQQLVRTAYLDRGKTLQRKLREILLACKLETLQSKEDILEQYLNWVSFGGGIAGIEQASRRFFGVSAASLDLAQSAVLAALPQRPTYFSPYGPHLHSKIIPTGSGASARMEIGLLGKNVLMNDEKFFLGGRANLVLGELRDQEYITARDHAQATKRLLRVRFLPRTLSIQAPHFILSLKADVDALLQSQKVETGSTVRIMTTLDLGLQRVAERMVEDASAWVLRETGARNIALLAIDRKTHEVRAYVGNTDFFDTENGGQIDILHTPRAVGSTLKPFVYAMRFEQGESPESPILDLPLDPALYRPGPTGYYGQMTMRTALARSRNIPAIRAFYDAGGEDVVLETLRKVGIESPLRRKQSMSALGQTFLYSWTLVLGAAEASPLEMAQGFSVLMNEGVRRDITSLRGIFDRSGNKLPLPFPSEERIFLRSTALEMTDVLSDENAREPAWRHIMHLSHGKAAIKTGTATICGFRDFFGACRLLLPVSDWTVGYDEDLLVVVWVGNVDHSPMDQHAASIMVATPLWQEFMRRAHDFLHP